MDEREQIDRIEKLISGLHAALTEEEGVLRVGLNDILNIRGMTAMGTSVITNLHNQVQALVEVLTMLHGRQIEHGRVVIKQAADIHEIRVMVEGVAHRQDPNIAAQLRAARAELHETIQAQFADLDMHAEAARELLRSARLDAREKVQQAGKVAQDEIAVAAVAARATVADAEHHALDKIKDATEEAS